MHPLSQLLAMVIALSFSGPAPDVLGTPSPGDSTVPACLVFCPLGDSTTVIVVRDNAHNAIMNAYVTLDFSACPVFVHCPSSPPYVFDDAAKTVSASTGLDGVVRFQLEMGGVCPSATVKVRADGILLRECSLASPDQDGDLLVSLGDAAIAGTKEGTADATADFNCDGVVGSDDVAVVDSHFGHLCDQVTPSHPRSWGSVKIRYH